MGFQKCKGCFITCLVLVVVVNIGVAVADPAFLDIFNPKEDPDAGKAKDKNTNTPDHINDNNSLDYSDDISGKPHIPDFIGNNSKNKTGPDSKFHILIQEIRIPLSSFHSLDPDQPFPGRDETDKLPAVEFDKLKDAAKQAGLSDAKAGRVARAAELLNASFDQVAALRKVMLNPTTSADHADQVRQQLEEAAIQKHTQPQNNQIFTGQPQPIFQGAGSVNGAPVPLSVIQGQGPLTDGQPAAQPLFQPNPNPAYQNPNLPAPNAEPLPVPLPAFGAVPVPVQIPSQGAAPFGSAAKIDPVTLQRLNVSSKLAGLKTNETNRFLRAILDSDLNATQVDNLQNVMTKHAPTADDLHKLTDALEKNVTKKQGAPDHLYKQSSSGAEWVSSDSPNAVPESSQPSPKVARSFFNTDNTINNNLKGGLIGNSQIYTAVRHCGISPKYPVTQWTNVAPSQYPWSVAIFTSDDIFVCSGSLISDSIVLTTASCVLKFKKTNLPLKLVVGAFDLPDDPLIGLPQIPIYAKSAVTHSLYNEASPNIRYNVGLLRLTEVINFDLYPHIFPVCIVSRSLLDPKVLSDQCTVTGWPELPSQNNKHIKSYITGANVTGNVNGCPQSASACISGPANIANEGSPVICPGSSNAFYQWGIVAADPSGTRTDTVNIAVVSVVDNYDFISRYLWTSSPST